MTNSLTHYLIIDSSRIDNLLQVVYEKVPQPNFGYLYETTPYDHLKKSGPLWVEVEPNSELWNHWFNTPLWSSSGIVCSVKNSVFLSVLAQLHSRIEVLSPTSAPLYFRFHSPNTLQRFMISLEDNDKSEFWGCINEVHWLVPESGSEKWSLEKYTNQHSTNTSTHTFRLSHKTYQELQA